MVIDLGILSIKVDVLIIQVVNIALLLWIIRKAFGDAIVAQIAHFRDTRKKLSEADETLKGIIREAEMTRQEIIDEGKEMKNRIVGQAHQVAIIKEKEIVEGAERKAKEIISHAQVKANNIETEIKDQYTYLIKESASSMVKKIFEQNPQAQETYVKHVVQHATGELSQ